MKKSLKITISLICLVVLSTVAVLTIVLVNKNKLKEYVQVLDYTESADEILNPDQGFYRTARITVTPTEVEDKTYVIKSNFQVYHLRMDISAFSGKVNGTADLELTEEALAGIDNTLKVFFEAGKNVIIRFAYDPEFDGYENMEPAEETILKHIEQVCEVLNKYPLTLTAIEAGMVGPWGEMHSSEIANAQTINKIIDKFLKCTTTSEIPVLVRTPEMIYNYLNITINDIENHTISASNIAYRLGMFNDGYLGSDSDLGTYDNREIEVAWISQQTSHLPYGGEVTKPNSTLHDIDKCLPEMFDINLSYLNYEWNDEVVQTKWQEQLYTLECGSDQLYLGKTAYEYINNHLGYRFVLKQSVLKYSDNFDDFKVELTLQNVGFGNLNRTKQLDLIFVKDEKIAHTITNVGTFSGSNTLSLSAKLPSNMQGKYEVYLSVNSKDQLGKVCYPVKFANNLWNQTLSANLIGNIEVK